MEFDNWRLLQKRYGILFLSANKGSAQDYVETFEEIIEKENLTRDQIYNANETGLFYRMMPLKSLASKEEASAPGYKKSKYRVSLLVCANALITYRCFALVNQRNQDQLKTSM
ncbi:hypothetical protein AVEN_272694-1 [Araneus ventricosus]|uniref:Uncharacterized protein n=1 Tax=Araneus ventricosus TaxID=182803 RepID=A0A4Y2LAR1_ARAVE|nr:hypothetical protein AVEN_272694-1 [Araneus ventricosus]